MKPTDKDKTQVESPSTRWWESYLVRYFVGFIVGSICVAIIINQANILDSLIDYYLQSQYTKKPDWTALIVGLGFLGVMYCYIASTPITVLHAARYRQGYIDSHARHFWLGWLIACIVFFTNMFNLDSFSIIELSMISILLMFIIFLLPIKKDDLSTTEGCKCANLNRFRAWFKLYPGCLLITQIVLWAALIFFLFNIFINCIQVTIGTGEKLTKLASRLWMLSLPVIWIGFTQYFVLFRLLNEHEKFMSFYKKLFIARSMQNAKDIRDTYTHLREHSNSVFIVVVELGILASILALIETTKQFKLDNQLEVLLMWLLFGLFFWMIPTVFMWGRANVIESDFSKTPGDF